MDGKIAAYRHADTMGKSQIDLILMVYDGAIKALRDATNHYSKDENDAGYEQLQHAKRFVTHLYTTLDMSKGGEVAKNLSKMYVWVISQLFVVEASKDVDELGSVTKVMENLRFAWAEIKEQQDGGVPVVSQIDEVTEIPELNEEFVTTG